MGEDPADAVGGPGPDRPGAAQLELLRLLNQAGPRPHLAGAVLGRAGPGRGRPDLPLPARASGLPAAPAEEVLRVATGVLADLAAALPLPPAPAGAAPRARRRGPSYLLDGLPLTVAGLRADLARQGVPEHRRRRRHALLGDRGAQPDLALVVVGPLPVALRQVWSRRVQEGSLRSWHRTLSTWRRRGALPPAADLARTVEHWVGRIGPERTHLVTAEALPGRVADLWGVELRGRAGPHRVRDYLPGDPRPLDGVHTDLLRRVNAVLPFVVPDPEDLVARRAALVGLMSGESQAAPGPAVPVPHRGWAAGTAVATAAAVATLGCRVYGDPGALRAADPPSTPVRLVAADLAGAAVRMIHRVDDVVEQGTGGGT